MGRERLWWWLHPYTWISSIALLPWLPGFPPPAFPTTISSLTSPQSVSLQSTASLALGFTIPKLHLPASAPSRRPLLMSGICTAAARTVWFSFHLDWLRSAVSLSALTVSPLTQTVAPMRGLNPCFSSPTSEGRSSPTNTPVFSPSSFILWSFMQNSLYRIYGSIYSFWLVQYSCVLWAGVLHALLCLKLYSWYVCGERCTPCPPTAPPSFSPLAHIFLRWLFYTFPSFIANIISSVRKYWGLRSCLSLSFQLSWFQQIIYFFCLF